MLQLLMDTTTDLYFCVFQYDRLDDVICLNYHIQSNNPFSIGNG